MIEDVQEITSNLSMIVSELANSDEELEKILLFFDEEHGVDKDTRINGVAAFDAIYFTWFKEIIADIYHHRGDGSNVFPYASIVVLEALMGKDKAEDKFIEVSIIITKMMGDVIKAFR
jgi:hypothetical protein